MRASLSCAVPTISCNEPPWWARRAHGPARGKAVRARLCPPYNAVHHLPRQRIRPDLELHHLRQRTLAALEVERRALAVGRPDAAAFPAGVGIVDATVHALGIEAERVGHAHVDPLAVDEREDRLVGVAGRHRRIGAETRHVELIDPGVVARLDAARLVEVLELRAGERIERPALRTMPAARGGRAVEHLA